MPPELEDLSTELDQALEDQAGTGGTDGQDGAAAPADGAGSSAAQAKTEDEGLLGVVRDAAPSKKPDPAAASPADGAEAGDKPGEGTPKKEPAEDFSDVPFNKHPRFRQLLSERNGFKGDAEKYRQVDTFIRDNGMSAQEAADLLTVGAMAKTNPAKAWELARPWVENLLKAAGEVLAPELEQAVQEGRMTREAAYDLSRSRATVASMEAARSFEGQRAEQKARDDHAKSITDAAQSWEDTRRERDPGFDAKLEPIHRELAWRHRNGDVPKDAAGVQAQLDDVYKTVNAQLAPQAAPAAPQRQAPTRQATKPVTGGSVAGGNAKPAPRSMLEVVQQAG
jgi:hypothetical protein